MEEKLDNKEYPFEVSVEDFESFKPLAVGNIIKFVNKNDKSDIKKYKVTRIHLDGSFSIEAV